MHGPKQLQLRLSRLALATCPIGRSPASPHLGKASATQNNLNAPARLSLSSFHLIATFSVASPGKRAYLGYLGSRLHCSSDCRIFSLANFSGRSRAASDSTFRLCLFTGCIHRRTVDSSAFRLLVVYRKYYHRTSSLSIRAFALSRAIRNRTPTTSHTLHATARHPPTWVFPLCSAGSARNTPKSCPVS